MFARLQRRDRLRGMIRNRAVDMNEVNLRVLQDVVEIGVALGDAEVIRDLIELSLVTLADGIHVGIGVLLVDRDELRAKTQTDDRDVDLAVFHLFTTPQDVPRTKRAKGAPGGN